MYGGGVARDEKTDLQKIRTLDTMGYDALLNLQSIKFAQCLHTDLQIWKQICYKFANEANFVANLTNNVAQLCINREVQIWLQLPLPFAYS